MNPTSSNNKGRVFGAGPSISIVLNRKLNKHKLTCLETLVELDIVEIVLAELVLGFDRHSGTNILELGHDLCYVGLHIHDQVDPDVHHTLGSNLDVTFLEENRVTI